MTTALPSSLRLLPPTVYDDYILLEVWDRRQRVAGMNMRLRGADWEIGGVMVLDAWRRKGIATFLYEQAASIVCELGGDLISTERTVGAYSHDFWKKQLDRGRAVIDPELVGLDGQPVYRLLCDHRFDLRSNGHSARDALKVSRLGETQLALLEVYAFDPTHDNRFPGWVEDSTLYFYPEHADLVNTWLLEVANGLDDLVEEGHAEERPWRDAAVRLQQRVGRIRHSR